MSDINKRIHENAATLAKVKVGACLDCGLDSLYPNIVSCHTQDCDLNMECEKPCDTYTPCPACATLREIADSVWLSEDTVCILSGKVYHRPFTVQSMRTLLEELGEWEGFEKWIFNMEASDVGLMIYIAFRDIMDTLTSDTLMREAVDAYLEHRVREVG